MKDWWRGIEKEQRLRVKFFLCILGLILLTVLLLARLIAGLGGSRRGDQKEDADFISDPVVEILHNVWIMEMDKKGLVLFYDGEEQTFEYASHEVSVKYSDSFERYRDQVADVTLSDQSVSKVEVKTEKRNGRILRADATGVWVENMGFLPFDEYCKGYRIYGKLSDCTYRDIPFGYENTDLVIEQGKVCALLLARQETMEMIRVLIRASDYAGLVHPQVSLTADTAFTVSYHLKGEVVAEHYEPGEQFAVESDSALFSEGCIEVSPDVLTGKLELVTVHRSLGTARVRGRIELWAGAEGITMINELPLEEYLYCVLPSEMPASYPGEALKAQAICARTYAYGHMQQAGYPEYGAHVDDSTSFQVYNNVKEQASTTNAVKETYGEILLTGTGECTETFYYSTSCGIGSDATVWKTESAAGLDYLKAKPISPAYMSSVAEETSEKASENAFEKTSEETSEKAFEKTSEETSEKVSGNTSEKDSYDIAQIAKGEMLKDEKCFREWIELGDDTSFEKGESWYRWNYEVKELDAEVMYERLKTRYEANPKFILSLADGNFESAPVKKFEKVTDLRITKRGAGGVADELLVDTNEGCYKVITEHNIRWILDDGVSNVIDQEGREVAFPNLLPSAFFVIDIGISEGNVVGYSLTGGGYGHGVGMSQNGAKAMAESGYSAEEILGFFYENCNLQPIRGEERK